MNNTLLKPVGIDSPIQHLQTWLYDALFNEWGGAGLPGSQFEMFGRVYKNWKGDDNGGYIPEVFAGGIEYDEVFFNDKISALLWFAVNDPDKVDQVQTQYSVSLYGFVDLSRILPDSAGKQRDDMAVTRLVQNLIKAHSFGFTVTAVYRDVDNVLSHYPGSRAKAGIKRFNMQPRMCFRIDMTIVMNIALATECGNGYTSPVLYKNMVCAIRIVFKDVPDTSIMQTLCNGVQVQLEYPTGNTVTVPALYGRYVLPIVFLDNNVIQSTPMPYNPETCTFDNSANGGFYEGSIMTVEYNLN